MMGFKAATAAAICVADNRLSEQWWDLKQEEKTADLTWRDVLANNDGI